MNLGELTSKIYPTELKDQEAFTVFLESMKVVAKVHPKAKVFFAQNDQENQLIQAFIEKEIKPLNDKMVMWHGLYRGDAKLVSENPAEVEFWFFMHSLLVVRNLKENRWGFSYPATKRQFEKVAATLHKEETKKEQ